MNYETVRLTNDQRQSMVHEIIPRPSQAQFDSGVFILNPATVIGADQLAEPVARYLSQVLAPATGLSLRVETNGQLPAANVITFCLNTGLSELGEEGYQLSIRPNAILIRAYRPAGLFYACQTLRQLLPKEILSETAVPNMAWILPCGIITDQPRFPWRGLMLDVARHFMPVDFIKRYIDLLAFYKMNRLHLHLTDGQAWTLEITKYLLLTQVQQDPQPGMPRRGVYSQQDMREIIAYANARHVMIIPEIEFPSHSDAILHKYPELLCVNHPSRSGREAPLEFCPGRDDVYQVIEDILAEVAALFPAPYIHIGGDEYYGMAWEQCPDCRQRIEYEDLEAEDSGELQQLFSNCHGSPRKYLLYRYMMRRIARMVVAQDRIPILWDDLAWQGKFPEQSVILQWHYRGLLDWMHQANTPENPALLAARDGHAAIAAPASHLYFDYFDGGKLLKRVYEFEPVPRELAADQAHYILGSHACMWECPQEKIDGMLFPRLVALAEHGWTAAPLRQWEHFLPRLREHLSRLDTLGVQYAVPSGLDGTPPEQLVLPWDFPRSAWMKEWWLNEIMIEAGAYEVTFTVAHGEEAIARLFFVDDGHEILLYDHAQHPRVNPATEAFHFTLSEMKPASLYSIRMYFHGGWLQGSRGEGVVKKMITPGAPHTPRQVNGARC